MSQPRLYLDEDCNDQDHLTRTSASVRALYTFNVGDYCVLHQAWLSQRKFRACIIVAPQQRYSLGEELRRLVRLIGSMTAEDMENRIEFLSAWV